MQGKLQTSKVTNSTARQSAAELLPQVYDHLRRLAAARMAQEKPGQTLAPTALVHEAWLKLARQKEHKWKDSSQFFFAAARAMRRILIDNARRKARVKHGGQLARVEFNAETLATDVKSEELLALDEALKHFSLHEPEAALLVELRYFAGLSHQEAAELLGISRRSADGLWAYARAWLLADLGRKPAETKVRKT